MTKVIMNILKELITIRKELQDIKLILKSQFLSDVKSERIKTDGGTVLIHNILPDPLKELRKEEDILQQHRKNGIRSYVVGHRKRGK